MADVQPRPVTPEDLAAIAVPSDVRVSPDGVRAAYVRTEIDAVRDAYRSTIWAVPADGGEPVQLTRGPGRDSAPRWSPDGRWLAFLSTREGGPVQLYLLPTAGGEPRRLTSLDGGAGPAVWTPDGARLVFSARVPKDAPPAGADAEARERWNRRPRVVARALYKADDAGFTFDAAFHLFVADLRNGGVAQLTAGDADHLAPAWAPDGTRLAFARARSGVFDYSVTDLWVMDASGRHARRLTENVGRAAAPAWAPDGTTIACYGLETQDPGFGDPMARVWLVPARGGAPACLTAGYDRAAALAGPAGATPPPLWSPDGATITFPVADAGCVHLARASVRDGRVEAVVGGERMIQSFSADPAARRIVFAATDWGTPAEVYACGWDGSEERRLTRTNEAVLSRLALPRVERRAFASPRGGALDGWLVEPLDGRRPAPLLLEIHGGPASYAGNEFPMGTLHKFVLPGRGWAVLALNPTGSGSYGKAFAHGIRGGWGEQDLPEQLAAVDALVAEGVVDEGRLAVSGYSYGGYMAAWTITHTDRFKAAVVGAPVVNLESFHGTSDIGPWFAAWEMRGDLIANRDAYRRLSPINYVERAATPTLIVHGEADDRCPIGQGEELFAGLVACGRAPVEFVRYPGAAHQFRGTGRPSHRIDIVRRVVEWVDRYVAGQT